MYSSMYHLPLRQYLKSIIQTPQVEVPHPLNPNPNLLSPELSPNALTARSPEGDT